MSERMSAAAYRELVAEKKPAVGSKRGTEPNPYRGLACAGCGKLVKSVDPAQLHTVIGPDGKVLEAWARHISCRAAA